jgi:hypothetical protein
MRPSDITKHRHGWLRPDGKFFACGRCEHLSLLDELGIHYRAADNLGWCKLGTGLDGTSVIFHPTFEPTQAQINALDLHCAAFEIPLPWWAGGQRPTP